MSSISSLDNPIEQVLSGRRHAVDVDAIEQELEELWRNVALAQQNGDHEPGMAISRACTVNLITYVGDPNRANFVQGVLQEFIGIKPSRAIVIINEQNTNERNTPDGAPENLLENSPENLSRGPRSWISAHCRRPGQGWPYVCCEMITISSQPRDLPELHSSVVSLLATDVPVCLWWCAPLPEDPGLTHLFNRLARACDVVIFNTQQLRNPLQDLRTLYTTYVQGAHRYVLRELTWLALHGWRELVARPFDDAHHLSLLANVDGVIVRYVADPNSTQRLEPPVAPVLLVGWLAERLDWEVARELRVSPHGIGTCTFKSASHDVVSVELLPGALPGSEPGTIIGVELTARDGSSSSSAGRIRFDRLGDGSWVRSQVRVHGEVSLERTAQFAEMDFSELLAQGASFGGQDAVFLRVLGKIQALLA
jgi:glucose-6-phosphate dehydrogenase assembly protein OpcA